MLIVKEKRIIIIMEGLLGDTRHDNVPARAGGVVVVPHGHVRALQVPGQRARVEQRRGHPRLAHLRERKKKKK